jgi:hypothetical protein
MKTELDCFACFVRQALATARLVETDDERRWLALRGVLDLLREVDREVPPPLVARQVYAVVHEVLAAPDPYAQIKRECNARALELLPRLRAQVQAAADPFAAAVKVALAGNIIDFGTGKAFDLERTSERVGDTKPTVDDTPALAERLRAARSLLYLADNAGEIALDALLLEQLPEDLLVTLAVRGGPIINDATEEDAAAVGLDRRATIIRPASALPGVCLEEAGEELREAFAGADVIISKGQGNFETLHGVADQYPIFFIFMVKCGVIAQHTGLPEGEPVVVEQRGFKAASAESSA